MIALTEEQRQAVAQQECPTLIDPKTNETYVLIRSAVYEHLRRLLHDDTAVSKHDVAHLVARAMKEYDENDPALELYQHD